MSKKVLICTANYYTSKFQVGSHNYARAFEKLGYEVCYLSNPISPLHKIFAHTKTYEERELIHRNNGQKIDNIYFYVPKSLVTPQNKSLLSTKFIFNNWHKLSTPNLTKLLKKQGFDDIDILWIESPYFSFLLDTLNYKKSILRLADYSKGFRNSWELLFQKEIKIAQKVDRVIYSSKILEEQYKEIEKEKTLYISNGIDLEIVKRADKSFPPEFNDIPSPRALYIGMIDYWFDVNLVYESANANPNFSFVLIGDSVIDLSKLEKLENIFILGSRPHHQISKYMTHSDIGIIPFIRDSFVDCINPIKLYEYAAYELKIVTTKWKEIEDLSEYCSICETKNEFISEISRLNQASQKKIDLWLQSQSWDCKVKKAIDFSI